MLTFTEFSGSPYHVGLALGKFGAPAVHNALKLTPAWSAAMRWRGTEHVQAMQQLVEQHHPYIWDELQGLARGLELPPEDVFLWNCRHDLPLLTMQSGPDETPDSSSDITVEGMSDSAAVTSIESQAMTLTTGSVTFLMPTADGPRITHCEYGHPAFENHSGIAEFVIDQGPEFAAFIYPGSLPGHSFSVTDKGLCMTVNAIQTQEPATGIPGIVLARALLNAPDLSSAIQMLNGSSRAGNLHLSLAQSGGSALLSIEFSTSDMSIRPVKATLHHTNHLIHESMQGQPHLIREASTQRFAQGAAYLNQTQEFNPLAMLAEQHIPTDNNKQSSDIDTGTIVPALATVDIHVHSDAVQWDIYEQPGEPARFRMRNARHI